MRALALLAAGCGTTWIDPEIPAETDTGAQAAAPTAVVHVEEWAAGSCEPMHIPPGSIVQLQTCNTIGNGSRQCWIDEQSRLTLIDGTAYVLCDADPYGPDLFRLTWIAVTTP